MVGLFMGQNLSKVIASAQDRDAVNPHAGLFEIIIDKTDGLIRPQPSFLHLRGNMYSCVSSPVNEQPLPPKSIGALVRSKLGIETMKTRGVYVIGQCERSKVDALAARYGLAHDEHATLFDIAGVGLPARSAKICTPA